MSKPWTDFEYRYTSVQAHMPELDEAKANYMAQAVRPLCAKYDVLRNAFKTRDGFLDTLMSFENVSRSVANIIVDLLSY